MPEWSCRSHGRAADYSEKGGHGEIHRCLQNFPCFGVESASGRLSLPDSGEMQVTELLRRQWYLGPVSPGADAVGKLYATRSNSTPLRSADAPGGQRCLPLRYAACRMGVTLLSPFFGYRACRPCCIIRPRSAVLGMVISAPHCIGFGVG